MSMKDLMSSNKPCNTAISEEIKSPTPSSHQSPPDLSESQRSPQKEKHSKEAEYLATKLKGTLAWDDTESEWYGAQNNIWVRISQKQAMRLITKELTKKHSQGFDIALLNGVTTFLQLFLLNDSWCSNRKLLPLQNGILNISTKKLSQYGDENRFTWQLPFKYDPRAKCPTIIDWLNLSTNGDKESIATIKACFYLALVGTADIQKFLEVVGPGGTGKSTLVRLLIALIGKSNHVVTDLKNLENNRFESAIFYEKRLAVISDSSRYGGEVSMLKSITGGDPIRFEKKNKQQGESFIADCLVIIASNEVIQSADYSSGLSRRRIPITFERRVSEADKEKWRKEGGLETVMHSELSGLLNLILELSIKDVRSILCQVDGALTAPQRNHLVQTNKIAAWLDERCVLVSGCEIFIGGKPKKDDSDSSVNTKLYPSYLDWCERENIQRPIALQRFSQTLDDLNQTLKLPVKLLPRGRDGRTFSGITIRNSKHLTLPTPITQTVIDSPPVRQCDDQRGAAPSPSDECDECDGHSNTTHKSTDVTVSTGSNTEEFWGKEQVI